MNPTFYFISGILVYIISLFTLVTAICFFMGVISSSSNFNPKERIICFLTSIFFAIPTIIGYDWASKLVDPDPELYDSSVKILTEYFSSKVVR